MSIEPTATRKGLDEMAALLTAAYGLVAQLSAARLDARLGVAPSPDPPVRDWLEALLAPKSGGTPPDPPPPYGRLAAAALAVVEAARRYQRADQIEADGR
jgi:hypothetical protein